MGLLLNLSLTMRIPAPDRLQSKHVIVFTMALFMGQLIEGTDFVFAVLTAVYILLWASAFNISGGIKYPSGAFVFFNGFLNVVVGLGFKVFLGQPGERNLQAPNATMFVYCVGMAAMLCAVFVCRHLRPQHAILSGFDSVEDYKRASIICLVVGTIIMVLTAGGTSSTSFLSAVRQINKFPQLSIMLATIYEIKRSNGKRSFNWIVTTGLVFVFAAGLLSFGKEGMLLGFVAYTFAAVMHGYNFPKLQIVAGILGVAFFTYYLVPYSQYARNYKATTVEGNIGVAIGFLGKLGETRELFHDTLDDFDINVEPHLYDKREGFIDRLIVLPADDALVAYTNKGHVFGLSPIFAAYANVIPRFIWRNKPTVNSGNSFAHELGEISDDDFTTGISFSAAGEAYHQATWLGLLLLLPINMFLYFIISDTVVGNARVAPWALVPILDLSEIGPDGGLSGVVYYFTYGILAMLVAYWIIKVAAPFVINSISRGKPLPLAVPAARPIGSSAS